MRSATNVQLQQSAYFPTAVTPRTTMKRTAGFAENKVVAIPQLANDMLLVHPDGVVASSESLGWQNLRAVEMRYITPHWTMPPIENHCIIIQLGRAVDINVGVGE